MKVIGVDPYGSVYHKYFFTREFDHAEIYRITVAHEFPWDMNQSLSFALFRTYAVPSIGGLLDRTGELTGRT